MSLIPLRSLVLKDLKVWRGDRRAVLISLVLPALMSLMFGLVFKRAAAADVKLKVDVVDEDGSETSQKIVAALAANHMLTTRAVTGDVARDEVRRGKVDGGLLLPKGFGMTTRLAVAGGRDRANLVFITDPTHQFENQILKGVVRSEVEQVAIDQLGTTGRDLHLRCDGLMTPYWPKDESIGKDAVYDGPSHAVAGMGVQFILMGAIEMAVVILTDRQRGVWKRMRAAPLSRVMLLGSKILSGALISLLVLCFLYAFGHFTMGIGINGSPVGFALIAVTFALMTSALGLCVSTLAKTPQAARGVGIFVILLAVMLGGAWFPTSFFPPWLRTVTVVMPTRQAVDGLDNMTWKGMGLESALVPAAVLLLSAVILGAIAVWRFRWEE